MKHMVSNAFAAALGCTAFLGFSSATWAGQVDETVVHGRYAPVRSVTVQYDASKLDSAEARAELQAEIKAAARDVCGSLNLREAGSLRVVASRQACYESAVAAAHAQLEREQVASR